MVILEENFKWHLEAFASELFTFKLSIQSSRHCNNHHSNHHVNPLSTISNQHVYPIRKWVEAYIYTVDSLMFFDSFQHSSSTPSPHTCLVTFLTKCGGSTLGSEPCPPTPRQIHILLYSDLIILSVNSLNTCFGFHWLSLYRVEKKRHCDISQVWTT